MQNSVEECTRLGIMSFYQKSCLLDGDQPKRESDDDDSSEQRIRGFLSILLAGIESQEVRVYGGNIENIRKYIKTFDGSQRYELQAIGDEKPQYRKIGAHARPALLRLQMFDLEEITVDPAKLLGWMMGRKDRREFLAPSARPLAEPATPHNQPPAIILPNAPAAPRRGYSQSEVTQKKAAELCGVSIRTIWDWERGKHTPTGYLGRDSMAAFVVFANRYKEQKAIKKGQRAIDRATPGGDMSEYSEDDDIQ